MDSHFIFYDGNNDEVKKLFVQRTIIEKSDDTQKFFHNFNKAKFVNLFHWIFVKLSNPDTFGLKYKEDVDGMVYLDEEQYRAIFDTVLNIDNAADDSNVYYNKLIDFIHSLNKHQLLYIGTNLHTFDFTINYETFPDEEFIKLGLIPDYEMNFSNDQNSFVSKEKFINDTYMIEKYYNDAQYFENVVFSIVYKLKHKNGNVLGYDYIKDSNIILTNYQLLKIFNIICNTNYNKEKKMYNILMNMSKKQLSFYGI